MWLEKPPRPAAVNLHRRLQAAAQIQQQILQASEADLAEATRRFQIVSRALRGERHDTIPSRTLRRWIAAYRVADREWERLPGPAAEAESRQPGK